jgi:nitroreductase
MTGTVARPEGAVFQAIYERRAVRAYAPTPVPAATIHALLEAAVQAPTAMHYEPWAFVVIQNAGMLKRCSDRAKAMLLDAAAGHMDLFRQPGVTPGDDHLTRRLADPAFNIFYDAGTLIIICGKPRGYFVTADCWLAAENVMLAACALHLGTCCIGLAVPLFNTPEVKGELHIPADVTAVAPIIVGTPAGTVPALPRRPPEILHWAR